MSSKGSIALSFAVPSRMIFLMWLVYFIEFNFGLSFSVFSIYPRNLLGLIGVITAPLLHASIVHLISNTFPLLILGVVLYFYYGDLAKKVFLIGYFIPNVLVWIFGRPLLHLGASGLIYAIAAFLFVSGLVRIELRSVLISIVVALLYGGLIWGVVPSDHAISWEMHLAGALTGGGVAFWLRNSKIK